MADSVVHCPSLQAIKAGINITILCFDKFELCLEAQWSGFLLRLGLIFSSALGLEFCPFTFLIMSLFRIYLSVLQFRTSIINSVQYKRHAGSINSIFL